jgi:AccI restriction endonuclease
MTYFAKIQSATETLVVELRRRGVEDRYLHFDRPGDPVGRRSIPTDARSEFLANRAMGDWAETLLTDAIIKALPDKKVVHYGDSDRMEAGESGFKEFYLARLEDVRVHGKRPDLLVMPKEVDCPLDVSDKPTHDLITVVEKSDFAIEVRSSKFEAIKYMQARKKERDSGKKTGRETPSFTVKIEDLKIVYRWLEKHKCPQVYCQVFFDSIFAINFLTIFMIICSGKNFTIENPKKNQEKATIMIPITMGLQIARCSLPDFTVKHRVTRLGRYDAFVRPIGGTVELDSKSLLAASSAA